MFRPAPDRPAPRRVPTRSPGVVARLVAARLVAVGGLLSLAVAAAGTGGCAAATDKQVIAQADQAHGELEKAVITEPGMADYIQRVGDRIVTTAGRLYETGYRPKDKSEEDRSWMFSTKTMRFHFVNSKTLNAFTTGGEHMYVYTELLRRCRNEQELAAVVAHEYGHVFGRHVQEGMSRQSWALIGAGVAGVAGYAAGGKEHGAEYATAGAGLGAAVVGLGTAKFSREDETEADKLGFDFFVRAGYHPDHFADFFRTLLEVEQKSGGGSPEFLSDHPSTARRVAAAEGWSAEYKSKHKDWEARLKPPVAGDAEFRSIQQRSTELAGRLPDDKSLDAQKLVAALPRSCLWPDEPQPASAKRAQQDLARDVERRQPAGGSRGEDRKPARSPGNDY